MRYISILSLVLISSIVLCAETRAQTDQPQMDKGQAGVPLGSPFDRSMCTMGGVSAGGFDLVSYRHPDGPALGAPEFAMDYNESTYRFTNQSNLDTFRADPERYLPAYAGFCAITLALGRVTCPDFSNFKIEDDRLLLFEVTGFTNGRILWDTNPEDFRIKADANFDKLNKQQ